MQNPIIRPGALSRTLTICLLAILFSCIAHAQSPPLVIPLWPGGAPGFEQLRDSPEIAKDYWVRNIHNPSLTVFFPPREKANGAAVLICPGGGHRELVYQAEGVEPAQFFNSLGVTAFVLKYRLSREPHSPYSIDKHPREDAYRAMRMIRSHAKEWNLDSNRIGMMGFSAGGEVVNMIAYAQDKGNPGSRDPVERSPGRPNFLILIYPGPLAIPDSIPSDSPPAFLLAANDDPCCSVTVVNLLQKFRAAKVPVEVHLYAQGNHAFNMGNRSRLQSIKGWPQRLADWMQDNHFIAP